MTTHVSAFGKDNLKDFFERFRYAYTKYKTEPTHYFEAEVFAIMTNHLYKDWLRHFLPANYDSIKVDVSTNLKMEMQIMRDIADGLKHINLSKPPHLQLQNQEDNEGTFDNTFDFSFDVPMLILVLQDSSTLVFEEVADKVFKYWDNLLRPNL